MNANKLNISMTTLSKFMTVLAIVGIAAFTYHFFVNLCGPYCFGID